MVYGCNVRPMNDGALRDDSRVRDGFGELAPREARSSSQTSCQCGANIRMIIGVTRVTGSRPTFSSLL